MVLKRPEPFKFLSLESCLKRSLSTHTEVDLAPHPVVGLVLLAGDAAKFPRAMGFESLDPFSRVSTQGPYFMAIQDDGNDERLAELEPVSCLVWPLLQ